MSIGRISVGAGAAILLLLSACVTQEPASAQLSNVDMRVNQLRSDLLDPSSKGVVVVAHRGCWRSAPENSLAAINDCIEAGVEMVELDVRETADGELVLIHDETLDRTTSLVGALNDVSLATLQAARLREGAGGPTAPVDDRDLRPPTLREALIAARGSILINIDAKTDLHDQIFEIVDETGTGDQVLMKMRAAPDDPALTEAAFVNRALFMPVIVQCARNPSDPRFCSRDLTTLYDDYLPLNPVAFEIVYTDDDFFWPAVPLMRNEGHVWVNTLGPTYAAGKSDEAALKDPEAVWGALVDGGVTMIQTDYPLVLIDFLEKTGRRGDEKAPRPTTVAPDAG